MSTPLRPYHAPPSIGHEIGVMFGFIGAMVVSMAAYGIAWQVMNKRAARKEAERIEALKASGWLKEKQGVEEERKEDLTEIPIN